MRQFLLRRLAFMLLSFVGATAIVFSMSRMAGDPLDLYATSGYGLTVEQEAALRHELRLDKPLVVQYAVWFGRVLKGDFGKTLLAKQNVTSVIGDKIGNSAQLGLAAWIFAVGIGVPLGVLSAVKRSTFWDYFARIFALLGTATPGFWIGLMLIYLFAVTLGWLPSGTKYGYETFPLSWNNIKHFILPAVVLGWGPAAGFLRITRSAMLEVLDSEFVKFARSKGVSSQSIIWRHALRNAIIPPLTLIALTMAGFLTGAVVVEQVFSWPGIGAMAVTATFNNDFPLMTGIVMIFVALFAATNFFADIAYAYVDPRIKYS